MIKKIKEIKNIGVFANFKWGGVLEFDKLTFIYGLNTYGKTTLTDIFQSLKDNDASILNSRKTIPIIKDAQKVHLSIKQNNSENQLLFQNNIWDKNTLAKNLEVFWTEFIHRNLFTGLSIERENKVNFTEFILGESGVSLSKDIAKNKKLYRDKKAELKNKIPNFIKNSEKEIIKNFINFDISTLNKDEISNNLIKKKIEKQEEEKRLKEPQKILSLPNIENYSFLKTQIINNFKNINNLLQKDYSNIKDEVLEQINNHIKNNFNNNDNVENWIKQGLNNCKDKKNGNCVFCGQNLQNAKELIDAYNSYFDEAYNNFIEEIENNLNINIENINNFDFSQRNKLVNLLNTVLKFKELIKSKEFQENLIKVEEKIQNLNEEKLNQLKKEILEFFIKSSELKKKKPYKKVEEINFQEISEEIEKYENILLEIKSILNILQSLITDFKNQYKNTKNIQEKISKLEKEINNLEYKKARIESDEDCKKCIVLKEEIVELNKYINKQEEKLQNDQSQYLNNYFERINKLFKKFGSHNFQLEIENNNRGDKPVYFLKVKFHGEEIRNDDFKTVFSESDKRALALAIFWTKIELKTEEEEKKETIIILDDPITSFDKERSRNFISYLKDYYNKLSQILIFTHYDFFIKQYSVYTRDSKPKVYELNKNNIDGKITSIMKNFDIDTFLKSDYIKYYDNIHKFIKNQESNFDETHLRIFFESCYLPIFKDKISKEKIDKYKSELSPANHKTQFENEESIRNYAKNMMEDLYSFQF